MSQPNLPAAWGQVLEHVELALKQAEVQAIERERAFPSPVEARSDWQAHWQGCVTKMRARTETLQHSMRQIERSVQEADAGLQEGEEALKQWLVALQSLGQDLAKWADRGVE